MAEDIDTDIDHAKVEQKRKRRDSIRAFNNNDYGRKVENVNTYDLGRLNSIADEGIYSASKLENVVKEMEKEGDSLPYSTDFCTVDLEDHEKYLFGVKVKKTQGQAPRHDNFYFTGLYDEKGQRQDINGEEHLVENETVILDEETLEQVNDMEREVRKIKREFLE